jgi:hypothetical protein
VSATGSKQDTEWERNLSKPNLEKSFDPFTPRLGFRASPSGGKEAKTSSFGLAKSFAGSKSVPLGKSFSSSAFYTPQFTTRPAEARSFSSNSFAGSKMAREADSRGTPGGTSYPQKSFNTSPPSLPAAAGAWSREYAGPEAQKKKIPYTPGNGPLGGTTYGRVLSMEEVREILNKSK